MAAPTGVEAKGRGKLGDPKEGKGKGKGKDGPKDGETDGDKERFEKVMATASLAKALHQGCCAACRWAQRHRQHDAQPVSRELGWDETQLVEQRATPCAPQATRSCAAGGCCTSVQHLAGLLHGATPPIRGGCGTSVQHPAPHGRLLYLRAATPLGRGFWTERPATSLEGRGCRTELAARRYSNVGLAGVAARETIAVTLPQGEVAAHSVCA